MLNGILKQMDINIDEFKDYKYNKKACYKYYFKFIVLLISSTVILFSPIFLIEIFRGEYIDFQFSLKIYLFLLTLYIPMIVLFFIPSIFVYKKLLYTSYVLVSCRSNRIIIHERKPSFDVFFEIKEISNLRRCVLSIKIKGNIIAKYYYDSDSIPVQKTKQTILIHPYFEKMDEIYEALERMKDSGQ